jgi:hypothetical protein
MTKHVGNLTWAVMGIAVLTFDLAAVCAVGPLALHAARSGRIGPWLEAGSAAAHTAAAAARERAVELAGDGLVTLAKTSARVYGTMQSLTPGATAGPAANRGRPDAQGPRSGSPRCASPSERTPGDRGHRSGRPVRPLPVDPHLTTQNFCVWCAPLASSLR